MKAASLLLAAFLAIPVILAEEEATPRWAFEIEQHAKLQIKAPQWHAKDSGWLFTCRVETPAQALIRPVAHLRFVGYDSSEEETWEHAKIIRRKDLDRKYGSGDGQFVRVIIEGVPEDVELVKLTFVNRPIGQSEDDS